MYSGEDAGDRVFPLFSRKGINTPYMSVQFRCQAPHSFRRSALLLLGLGPEDLTSFPVDGLGHGVVYTVPTLFL